jgi:DNA-binding MarR family transcriptional regulator
VLAAVVAAPGKRPTDHVKESLEDTGMSKADLSVYLRRLEEAGLVVRVNNPDDKRSFLYHPSVAGQNLVGDAVRVFQGVAKGSGFKAS